MKTIKKILTIALFIIITASSVSADTIYETVTNTDIVRGVLHSRIQRMTESGWQKINVLTADLSDEAVHIHALYDNRGISYRNTLTALLAENNADAGINADFFDLTAPSGRTSPLGLTAENGVILSSPSHDTALAALVQTDDDILTDYFQMQLQLVAENGNKMQILHINKYHSTASVIMFTKDWGEYTPAVSDGSCDMVIEKDIVTDMTINSSGTKIPENGCVLRVNPSINNFFAENFEIGDKAKFVLEIFPDCDIKTAVGGGTVLVKDGRVADFTNNVTGYNPRSAAGISEDKTKLFLVTVEGREKNTRGMTQKELAELMISLGSYSAINFDGGGSTEMAAINSDGQAEILNTPSDGAERRISTGLGISSGGEDRYFSSMRLEAAQQNVCIGDSVEIWCHPLDNYGKIIELPYNLEYFSDGGFFDGNVFYPQKGGENTITVKAGDVSETITLNVLSEISNLTFYPASFYGSSAHLSLIASDAQGNKSQINPSSAVFTMSDGNGSIDRLGNVQCDGNGVTISASFGSKIAYCNGNKPDELIPKIYDVLSSSIDRASFIVVPPKLKQNTFINCITNSFLEDRVSEYKNHVFSFGAYDNASVVLGGFQEIYDDRCAFISVDNIDTIYKSGGEQWKKLTALINCKQKNILLFFGNGYSFNDADEGALFKSLLSEYRRNGKNVFIISVADENNLDIENGIRYISLKRTPAVTLNNFKNSREDADYLKFYLNGDNLSYNFSHIIDLGR